MIQEILLSAGFIAVYAAACRRIKGSNKGYKRVVFGLLLAWGGTAWVLGPEGKGFPTLSVVYFHFYKPLGQAISYWLGG